MFPLSEHIKLADFLLCVPDEPWTFRETQPGTFEALLGVFSKQIVNQSKQHRDPQRFTPP